MNYKELLINAALAGLWAGLAAFTAAGELSQAALFAAAAVAIRAAVGYLASRTGNPIPVDR